MGTLQTCLPKYTLDKPSTEGGSPLPEKDRFEAFARYL